MNIFRLEIRRLLTIRRKRFCDSKPSGAVGVNDLTSFKIDLGNLMKGIMKHGCLHSRKLDLMTQAMALSPLFPCFPECSSALTSTWCPTSDSSRISCLSGGSKLLKSSVDPKPSH